MAGKDLNKELIEAVSRGNFESVKVLLYAGADVNCTDKYRNSLLHLSRNVEITKELLLRGASVRVQNMYRENPLIVSIKNGCRAGVIKELLEHGDDVKDTDRKGNTALNIAVKKSSVDLEVVKELLKHGSDINRKNHENRLFDNYSSPLDNAGTGACAELLIKYTVIKNFGEDYRKSVPLDPKKHNHSILSSYLDDCACEVFQMKTHMINKDIPLYEVVESYLRSYSMPGNFFVFSKCVSERSIPCSNLLSMKLKHIDFSMQYPIYKDIILDAVRPFF